MRRHLKSNLAKSLNVSLQFFKIIEEQKSKTTAVIHQNHISATVHKSQQHLPFSRVSDFDLTRFFDHFESLLSRVEIFAPKIQSLKLITFYLLSIIWILA